MFKNGDVCFIKKDSKLCLNNWDWSGVAEYRMKIVVDSVFQEGVQKYIAFNHIHTVYGYVKYEDVESITFINFNNTLKDILK